jgi:membrane-bound lytic murein transglycosylase D
MLCRKQVKKLIATHTLIVLVAFAAFHPQVCYSLPVTGSPLPLLMKLRFRDSTSTVATPVVARAISVRIALNKHVSGYVKGYIKSEYEFLQNMESKSKFYFHTIEKVLGKYDLPLQLKYLAIIESQLVWNARSHAGARGLWQLMPVTAKDWGLKVHGKTDERLDTYSSTVAAAKYIKYLYSQFGDWLLVLAAYNGGTGTVYKAIRKAGTHNYWALQQFLPAETRGHVKRFIGVHYYFEGQGSIVTQTKSEAKAWLESQYIQVAEL